MRATKRYAQWHLLAPETAPTRQNNRTTYFDEQTAELESAHEPLGTPPPPIF